MYKVMIVEDEWLVREGLKMTIPWEQVGCELVAEADDGLAALEMLERVKPDIVLTDIRMPGMDGIGLAEHVARQRPETKIVFLTGFDDFAYAQKAIKLGAIDFVLKPTNPDELLGVFGRVGARLDEERARRERAERMELRLVLGEPFIMEKLLHDMMLGHAGAAEQELFREYCLQGSELGEAYRVALVSFVPADASRRTAPAWDRLHKEEALRRLTSFPAVRVGAAGVAVLANLAPQRDELQRELEALAQTAALPGERFAAGVSGPHSGADTMAAAYEEALQSLYGALWNGSPVLWHEELESKAPSALAALAETPVAELLKRGTPESLAEHFAGWRSHWLLRLGRETEQRARFYEWLVALYSSLLKDEELRHTGPDPHLLLSPLEENESPDERLTRLSGMLQDWQRKHQGQGKEEAGGFEQIAAYIRMHYGEEITLQHIADRHHMSESHFSRLFKQHIGVSFLEYLTNVRVQKAKELLANPKLKIYEVSVQVGYQDSRYFSQIYRKYTGETPTEFRKRLGIEFLPL